MSTLARQARLSAAERERRVGSPGQGRRGVPAPMLGPAIVGVAFLVLPLVGLLLRTPWSALLRILATADVTSALRLSLLTATLATAVSFVLGVPLAWLLARSQFPGVRLLRALVTLPLVLPPVVGGVALLLAFGRMG